ncbi:hypothetical protein O181_012220, partial [Austropuccinia psidii MF-1]|nr:hypothetical protein [Austropuccinia psidii MF-1]
LPYPIPHQKEFHNSVSKITGSVSKGLSAAALDSNWAHKRQHRQVLNRNKVNGLVTGTSAFVGLLASNILGIAMKPIEGAVGFLKGLGKGLVGVIAKPAVGTFDFSTHDGILKPYNIREAQGQDCLRSVGNGKLHSCKYVAHIELPNDVDSVCILTTTRVVMIHTSKLKIVWQIELSELKEMSLEPLGIKLTLKGDHAGPFVALSDSSMKLWFFQHLKRLVKEYNNKKKRVAGVGGVQL